MTWRTFPKHESRPTDAPAIDNPARQFCRRLTLDDAKAAARQRIADSRFQLETAGVSFAGAHINTDRESQATIAGALLAVNRNPEMRIDWKGEVISDLYSTEHDPMSGGAVEDDYWTKRDQLDTATM